MRPSRNYESGIGKPVVAKRMDGVLQRHQWTVVFPPCNNFGCWTSPEESKLVGMAQQWCWWRNSKDAANLKKELKERT